MRPQDGTCPWIYSSSTLVTQHQVIFWFIEYIPQILIVHVPSSGLIVSLTNHKYRRHMKSRGADLNQSYRSSMALGSVSDLFSSSQAYSTKYSQVVIHPITPYLIQSMKQRASVKAIGLEALKIRCMKIRGCFKKKLCPLIY